MKTSSYSPWWVKQKDLDAAADGSVHDDETCDHRHFVSELNIGWKFWSPAGRLETITRMEPTNAGAYWWRIWTEQTGPAWSWRRWADDRVHAIPPNPVAAAYLRVVDLSARRHGASMHIVPVENDFDIPDFKLTLVHAEYLGAGQGWRVTDRPDGGDDAVTEYPSKAKAQAALLKAGRTHAKILGLKLIREDRLDR